ncbi:copper ion binding protein [bacterium]|nr:copper ion binding protein [bacterium]
MQERTYSIPGMTCQHCVNTIEREIAELEGVKAVKADLEGKKAVIQWDSPATNEVVMDMLREIGYPAED